MEREGWVRRGGEEREWKGKGGKEGEAREGRGKKGEGKKRRRGKAEEREGREKKGGKGREWSGAPWVYLNFPIWRVIFRWWVDGLKKYQTKSSQHLSSG